MVWGTGSRRNGSGGEVEWVRLRDLHKVHEISLVKRWGGQEVRGVEYVFAAGCVGVEHGG